MNPPRWTSGQKAQCLGFASDTISGTERSGLPCVGDKYGIQEHYGDDMKPVQLRMLAENIDG